MEALARAVMTQIPPNAIERQRVCEVIGRAERARVHGRQRDSSRMRCDVGAALSRLGREECVKIAERAFQRAVERANTPDADAPDYMKIVTEGTNSDLAEAYAHLGNCERALGKMVDAEGHYKAAARAGENEGLEAHANKFVHRVMMCRLRKDFERHEALCDAWEETIRRAAREGAELLAINDSARPLCSATDARRCFNAAQEYGAAVLAVQSKATIKEVNKDLSIDKGLDRSRLWEMQTPQVMRPQLLRDGFNLVNSKGLEVTDDVSIVEALGERVQVAPGSYFNLKVTTPEDMFIAERLMTEQGAAVN